VKVIKVEGIAFKNEIASKKTWREILYKGSVW
jgi:hypothetical protein